MLGSQSGNQLDVHHVINAVNHDSSMEFTEWAEPAEQGPRVHAVLEIGWRRFSVDFYEVAVAQRYESLRLVACSLTNI